LISVVSRHPGPRRRPGPDVPRARRPRRVAIDGTILPLAARMFFPPLLSGWDEFGPIGVAMALLTWCGVVGTGWVVTARVGAVLWERAAPSKTVIESQTDEVTMRFEPCFGFAFAECGLRETIAVARSIELNRSASRLSNRLVPHRWREPSLQSSVAVDRPSGSRHAGWPNAYWRAALRPRAGDDTLWRRHHRSSGVS